MLLHYFASLPLACTEFTLNWRNLSLCVTHRKLFLLFVCSQNTNEAKQTIPDPTVNSEESGSKSRNIYFCYLVEHEFLFFTTVWFGDAWHCLCICFFASVLLGSFLKWIPWDLVTDVIGYLLQLSFISFMDDFCEWYKKVT